MSQQSLAKLVMGLFFFTVASWSFFVPVFEAPDEPVAYEYARYVARTWKIPVLTEDSSQGFHHWQPLYFFLLAPIARVSDAPDSRESHYYFEDGWARIRQENPMNFFRHQPQEFLFDWDQIAWSLHLMRLVSVLLATGSVWLVYRTGREIFPEPSWIPIASMAWVGFNPQFTNLSGVLNVVDMVNFTALLLVWILVRYVKKGEAKWYDVAGLGAVSGISIIAKMTSLPLVPIALLAVVAKERWKIKDMIRVSAVFIVAFMITGGWYIVRNRVLYGELSGVNAQVRLVYGLVVNPFMEEVGKLNYFISYPKTQWLTFWSGFGWIRVHTPMIFPFLMAVLYLYGAWGFIDLMSSSNRGFLRKEQVWQLMFLGLSVVVVWMGITWTVFRIEVFNGKDMMLVAGPLAIVALAGLQRFWTMINSARWKNMRGKRVILSLLTVFAMFWFRQPELARVVKGIGTENDILALIWISTISSGGIHLSLWVCGRRTTHQVVQALSKRKYVPAVIVLLIAILNLSVLFGLVVPKMYHVSILNLLQ